MTSRVLAWAIAIAIAAGAFEPFYLRIFFVDRANYGASLAELPYRKLPGMKTFLLAVRERTHDGDAVAIAAPLHRAALWEGGYDYIYARARYLLAGRLVVPLIAVGDKPQPENIAMAGYIAGFHCEPNTPGFVVIWRSRDGVLLRRVK